MSPVGWGPMVKERGFDEIGCRKPRNGVFVLIHRIGLFPDIKSYLFLRSPFDTSHSVFDVTRVTRSLGDPRRYTPKKKQERGDTYILRTRWISESVQENKCFFPPVFLSYPP